MILELPDDVLSRKDITSTQKLCLAVKYKYLLMNNKQIGKKIGRTREGVSKAFRSLKRKNIID